MLSAVPRIKQAAGVQGVVHQRQELLLRLGIDVDQEVPATEDVELRERRIDEDVLRRKDHQVADFFLDPVALALAHEEPRQPLGRQVRGDARGKRALAGLLDGVLVDVGGKDLDRPAEFVPLSIVERNSFRSLTPSVATRHEFRSAPGTP